MATIVSIRAGWSRTSDIWYVAEGIRGMSIDDQVMGACVRAYVHFTSAIIP